MDEPHQVGQWAGPYDLTDGLTENGQYETGEIVHSALLPPAPEFPDEVRVLLSCDPTPALSCAGCEITSTGGQKFGRTYLWVPSLAPSNAYAIEVPLIYPQDGSQDFFCGTHAFLPDGDLLWAGGTDYLVAQTMGAGCPLGGCGFHGHSYGWRLNTTPRLPEWLRADITTPFTMETPRWYGTAMTLNTGLVLVAGNTGMSGTGSTTRNHYNPDTFNWSGPDSNKQWTATGGCLETTHAVDGYPHMHMLSSRDAIQTFSDGGGSTAERARFLELDLQALLCPPIPRWKDNNFPSSGTQVHRPHRYGGSVHLITHNGFDFTEVVYLVGGAEDPSTAASSSCTGTVHGEVEKMVSPSTSSAWNSAGVPDLVTGRVNHVTIILLDGSILVVGGLRTQGGTCVSTKQPELYMTPEVFGDSTVVWKGMQSQRGDRRYHSVGGLLPNGKAYSAGGRDTPPDNHSIEVFSPPYMFQGTRPVIDGATIPDPATAPFTYNGVLTFEATLAPGATVNRVALLRNGSSTHSTDFDQRYVQLRFNSAPISLGGNKWQLQVKMPLDGYQAPPGYYMITVIDHLHRPSPSEWIRLQ